MAAAQYSAQTDFPPRFEWRGRANLDYRSEFEAETDRGDEIRLWRLGAGGDFGGPINESILVNLAARYAHSTVGFNIDAGGPITFGSTALPRDPWNTINTVDLVPSTMVLIGDQFAVIAAVPIRYAGETGAGRNGFAAGLSGAIRWQPNEDFTVALGIGVTSQLEKDAETFPVLSLRWRVSESVEFLTEGDWFQGGVATLLWGSSDSIRLLVSAGYERTRFRLDDNGTAADTNGIGELTTFPLEVGLRLQFIESAYFEVRAGLGIAGRIRVESDNGRKLYDQKYDTAPRVGVLLSFPFGLPAARGGR